MGRYVGRPAIAESRIVDYDGVNVTFKYTRHEDNEEVIETILDSAIAGRPTYLPTYFTAVFADFISVLACT